MIRLKRPAARSITATMASPITASAYPASARPGTVSAVQIAEALRGLGIADDDALYVHSSVAGCARVEGGTSAAKLGTVLTGLRSAVARGVLLLPTYTYSFCNGEEFDVGATPSTVGALTEAFRRRPGVRRTLDPIFSTAVQGTLPTKWEARLFRPGDIECFGDESVFAYLAESRGKLLFLDVDFGTCTFVHRLERTVGVAYRYEKPFTGTVRANGRAHAVTASYFVRRLDEDTLPAFAPFAEALAEAGAAREAAVPDGPRLLVVDVDAMQAVLTPRLAANPRFLLASGHPPA